MSFSDWIGREQSRTDSVTASPIARLAATLDHRAPPWRDDELPPLGHWLYHLPDALQSRLGSDGHPERGGFLPPVPMPRRMWAGSRIRFLAPVAIGALLDKRTTILSIEDKSAPAGDMMLVTVRHDLSAGGEPAIVEEQDLVYLHPRPASRPRATDRPEPDWVRRMTSDPALLFRYSALTFNAHRIHYNADYARDEEGYPGLVVHGPLQATLLIDHALRASPGARVTAFSFRARAPLFCGTAFELCQAGSDLWVRDADGGVTMTAIIELEQP